MIQKLINKLFRKKKNPTISQYWIDAWNKNEREYRKTISEKFRDFEERMLNDDREIEEYKPEKGEP